MAERKERDREKEAAKMEQKMRLDKLKEQVCTIYKKANDLCMSISVSHHVHHTPLKIGFYFVSGPSVCNE